VSAGGVKDLVPGPVRRRVGPPLRAVRHPIDVPRHRLLTSRFRLLPDFLVIGAAKAGTSSAFFALKHHPSVVPPTTKELGFFDLHFANGVGWYRAHFPSMLERLRASRPGGPGLVTFEATPAYLFHSHAARRAAAIVPSTRLVAVLRDPVDRAYSHYWHHRRDGKETLSFEEAIDREEERIGEDLRRAEADEWHTSMALQTYSYLARGRYAEQLERWLRHFPRERLLVLFSERLYGDPAGVLRQLLEFLELPAWEPAEHVHRNPGGYEEDMRPETRQRLASYFAPHNQRLADLLGEDPGWLSA
jgi:hypothetical protein